MNSTVGGARERRKFVKTHLLAEPDNLFEILLRLVRGDRAGSSNTNNNNNNSGSNSNNNTNNGVGSSASSLNSSSTGGGAMPIASNTLQGPLAAAVKPNSHYAASQNHISLSVLALLKMTKEMADKAGVKKNVVDDQVADSQSSSFLFFPCFSFLGDSAFFVSLSFFSSTN